MLLRQSLLVNIKNSLPEIAARQIIQALDVFFPAGFQRVNFSVPAAQKRAVDENFAAQRFRKLNQVRVLHIENGLARVFSSFSQRADVPLPLVLDDIHLFVPAAQKRAVRVSFRAQYPRLGHNCRRG